MFNQIQFPELINSIINIILIPILPLLTAYLVALIKRKTTEIESQMKNKELAKYLDIAENAVITAVTAVNQVYVDALKKSKGSLTFYEQRVAFEMAREKVQKILGDSTIND
jgi:hypothetical protein